MKKLVFTAALVLLGSAAPAVTSRVRGDAWLQRRIATDGMLAVARDSGLSVRERSMLRLMAGAEGNGAALQVLGPEPRSPDSARFSIGPGTHFEHRVLPAPIQK